MSIAVYNADMEKEPANNIFRLRKDRGWTQQRLADAITSDGRGVVGKDQVSKHENGERQLNPSWMRRYAMAFGCKPEDIISGDAIQHAEGYNLSDLEKDVQIMMMAVAMKQDIKADVNMFPLYAKRFCQELIAMREAGYTDEKPTQLAVKLFLEKQIV